MRRLLVLIAFAFALAGCGTAPTPEEAVSDAGKNTTDGRTARIVVSFDDSAYVRGVFDFAEQTGVLEPDEAAGRTIVTREAVFVPITGELISTSRDRRWLAHPRADYSPLLLDPFADTPADLLEFLTPGGEVRLIGEGEERGEPVKHYSALLDVERISRGQEEFIAYLDDYWPGWQTEGVPFQLALDSEGRLRRADLVLADGEELTIELFDYGVEFDATPPDASEVLTWAEYEKLLRKECESLKKKGLEKTKPHCFSCGVAEGEV
jgi:hypothetical protein